MIFDTLKVSRDLQEAHFTREQAEALASTLNGAAVETLATKDDLRALGGELRTEMRTEIGKVRSEIGEVRTEIGEVRTEIGKIRTEMAEMKAEMQRWMFGLVVAQFFALAGLMLAFQKLMH